ncbi:calcium-regulated heat-stable protein 1-like [Liolophura sinensis]|uniref:calcium-regulated heat-stable protein 1-like n=1 Tax=Liolophura sinensis TaxID=3198878 RepID=UPI003158F241
MSTKDTPPEHPSEKTPGYVLHKFLIPSPYTYSAQQNILSAHTSSSSLVLYLLGATEHTQRTYKFLIPSPIPTRRNRTYSASQRAADSVTKTGRVKNFCRQKGHGFIIPDDNPNSQPLFVHISDIDGEFVPQEGDEVSYKTVLIPPRNEKYQAVHVKILQLAPGTVHERWDAPPSPVGSPGHGKPST